MVLESLIRRDRLLTSTGLAVILVFSWIYLLAGAGMGMTAWEMTRMPADMPMPEPQWSPAYALLMFGMWWVMMIAMMLPSAAPVILLAAALNRRSDPRRPPYGGTAAFTLGYFLAWAGFSIAAVIGQWWLQTNHLLSGMLAISQAQLAGLLLLAAACWQFTPLKQACLRRCRSPAQFLTERRRPGNAGAVLMGVEHGLYCVGCCWSLMLLLFVGGVMNLFWIAGLAILVLVEKLLPGGRETGYLAGAVLAAWGLSVLF